MKSTFHNFAEDEIPYSILEQFGLTREMIEDLPEEPYENILNGYSSPVLPIVVKNDDGTNVMARSRFHVVKNGHGGTDVVFYPRLMRCDLDRYTEEERHFLHLGRAIPSHSPDDDNLKCFVQIDPDTNQILYVPTPVIGRNLSRLADRFHLDIGEIEALQTGSPITFADKGEDIVACVDLTERTGIRLEIGRGISSFLDRATEINRYNFGLYGCWVKDDSGDLDYVHEDEYTDEIIAAQERIANRNSGMKR